MHNRGMSRMDVMSGVSLPWTQLFLAAGLEVVWAVAMPQTESFTQLWPSVFVVAAMVASFVLLARAIRTIPLGTAYAVWAGVGAAGTAIVGMLLMGEPSSVWRVVSLCAIVGGVFGLKLLHEADPPSSATKPQVRT